MIGLLVSGDVQDLIILIKIIGASHLERFNTQQDAGL